MTEGYIVSVIQDHDADFFAQEVTTFLKKLRADGRPYDVTFSQSHQPNNPLPNTRTKHFAYIVYE